MRDIGTGRTIWFGKRPIWANRKFFYGAGLALAILALLGGLYRYGRSEALSRIPDGGYLALVIELDRASLVYNDSVGNEWKTLAVVNGNELKRGKPLNVRVSLGDTLHFAAAAEEIDTVPDVGMNKMDVYVRSADLRTGLTVPIDVVVRENRGRYAGHTALWHFSFSIRRSVTFWDAIQAIL